MSVRWTEEQQRVIRSRNRNLLVSAAAGSGKTAVLIEHLLSLILDEDDPADVTELLVVTFTRAAASEMKDRLRSRLTDLLREPGNLPPETVFRAERQLALLDQARISTIDSFCQWLVRNYFYELDLDPDFRILDEGEGKLLRADVMEEVLASFYREADPEFVHFMDAFSGGKSDRNVRRLIEELCRFADSAPWPEEWLDACLLQTDADAGAEGLSGFLWAGKLEQRIRGTLAFYEERLREAEASCLPSDGLTRYGEMFASDRRAVNVCLKSRDPEELFGALGEISFVRKPVIPKKEHPDEAKKAALSALRDEIKGEIQKLQKKFAVGDPREMTDRIRASAADCRALTRLSRAFLRAYGEAKAAKNLADFADVEHWALNLLAVRKDGKTTFTELAGQLAGEFREVIVDEYQDSNLVQETILSALTRGNYMMVGDVKQSIYKFRMARPELFMEKYRTFSRDGDEPGRKIDLGRNFRSRPAVLSFANEVFSAVMGEGLGGVAYDSHARLIPGASYPGPDPAAETLLVDTEDGDGSDPIELEGKMIAARIRRLMSGPEALLVSDGSAEGSRPLRYRDIVILLRSTEGTAETLAQLLNREGIPAFAQQKKGYFAAQEIRVLLNFLRILDNPLQDIPLVSVMRSPLGGFTEENLARLGAGTGEGYFCLRCEEAAARGVCTEKWNRFREMLARFRAYASDHAIHEILTLALAEADYGLILAALPDGKVRTANVEMLKEQALAFEETSYHGIFQFLRYMEKLQKYEIDYGEAPALSENEDLVRITSIHRSKGLEYPVVFVANIGKSFNLTDARSSVLIHPDLGLACDAVDVKLRLKLPTLWKRFVAEKLSDDARGEELRVLYVAMTRAKEKLILTGTVRGWEKKIQRIRAKLTGTANGPVPPELLRQADSYLDWLMMAGEASEGSLPAPEVLSVRDLVTEEVFRQGENSLQKAWWMSPDLPCGEETRRLYEKICRFTYPWENICMEKTSYSVSELKRLAAAASEEEETDRILEETRLTSPEAEEDGEAKKKISTAADLAVRRGSAYHKIMEHLPPEEGTDEKKIRAFLSRLRGSGQIDEDVSRTISVRAVRNFYLTELGEKMRIAHARGKLVCEQPFVTRLPLAEILRRKGNTDPSALAAAEGEWVLVQGIIDAYLEDEDGTLVLWDYKTDFLREGEEAKLVSRYREQLRLYRRALEQVTGQVVKESWIYSFALGKAIRVEGLF